MAGGACVPSVNPSMDSGVKVGVDWNCWRRGGRGSMVVSFTSEREMGKKGWRS